MTSRLDALSALIPKAAPTEASVAVMFAHTSAAEIERVSLDELAQWMWIMCELFFQRPASNERTVVNILNNDAFSLAVTFLKRLAYADPDRQACLDLIEDVLVDLANHPDRKIREVEPVLVSACLLVFAVRNVRDHRPTLDRIETKVLLRDALYRALSKGLTDLLYAVRERFAPRAWLRS